jgi:pilus assembly protein Flp/PilA
MSVGVGGTDRTTSAEAPAKNGNTRMTTTLSSWTASLTRVLDLLARDVRLSTDDGQALVEYALIIALIALLAIAALTALGTSVSSVLQTVANDFP